MASFNATSLDFLFRDVDQLGPHAFLCWFLLAHTVSSLNKMTDSDKRLTDALAALDEKEQATLSEIARLQARLLQFRAARESLASLQQEEPVAFEGKLADACRAVLKAEKGSLAPIQVRDRVKALGYDFSKHDNVMAAVHGVLKRLDDSGDVKSKKWKKDPDVTRYYWVGQRNVTIPIPAGNVGMAGLPAHLQSASGTVSPVLFLHNEQEKKKE
ncbi:MAG: hypothetical protein ACRD2I_10095 [Vicinamibacterales bacterium]